MPTVNIRAFSHKKSTVIENGGPKLPTAAQLELGEIAINFAKGYETLSIKNNNNEIVTFTNDNYWINKELAIAAALNDLNDRKQDALEMDEIPTEGSENVVTSGGLYSYITEIEQVTAAALNDLNDRITSLALSDDYAAAAQGTPPLAGDTYETAISKLHKVIVDDELITSSALNDLNSRIDNLSLSEDYVAADPASEPAGGDTYEEAISKLHGAILENELATSAALNDLNTRISDIVVPELILSEDYEPSSLDNEDLFLEPGDSYETAFAKLEKAINDNENITSAALTDLDSRLNLLHLPQSLDDIPDGSTRRLSDYVTTTSMTTALATKQDTLVSGTNIKTINNESILGSGNITIQGGSGGDTNVIETVKVNGTALTPDANKAVDVLIKTIDGNDITGSGDLTVFPEIEYADLNSLEDVGIYRVGTGYICLCTLSGPSGSPFYSQTLIGSGGSTKTRTGNSLPITSPWITVTQSIKSLNTNNTSAQTVNASEEIEGSGTINLHKVSKTGSYSDLIKPSTGIPKTDLASAVQTSLGKADTSVQNKGSESNIVVGVGNNSNISITSSNIGMETENSAILVGNDITLNTSGVVNYNGSRVATVTDLQGKQDVIRDLQTIRDGAADGATAIQGVKVNGTALTPDTNKTINVSVPTKTSDITNDSKFIQDKGGSNLNSATSVIDGAFSNEDIVLTCSNHNSAINVNPVGVDIIANWNGSSNNVNNNGTGNVNINTSQGKAYYNSKEIATVDQIPSAVTESTVSGWGFTKNTGTYSKPSGGIPKTDLASAVQTSLGKADSAIQGVKVNGTALTPDSNKAVDITSIPVSIVTQDATHRFVSDTEKTTWNGKQNALQYYGESDGEAHVYIYDEHNSGSITLANLDVESAQPINQLFLGAGYATLEANFSGRTDPYGGHAHVKCDFGGIELKCTIDNETNDTVHLGPSTFTYNNKQVATTDQIPTKTSDLTNDSGFITSYTETDPTVPAWAKASTKPTYTAQEVGALPNTYTPPVTSVNGQTGAVNLTIPSAPGALNTTATTAQSTSSSEALSGNITLHKVAKTGTYSDLIGTPTIPTVNNATLTIQKNGTTVNTFTANASSNVTANIQVNELPTVSSSDNGKILQVVNGAWALVTPTSIYSGTSEPDSNTGNNGDLYLQTS